MSSRPMRRLTGHSMIYGSGPSPSREFHDPLREFSEACRAELLAVRDSSVASTAKGSGSRRNAPVI